MATTESLRERYSAASDVELREALAVGSEGFTADAWEVVAAEATRRGFDLTQHDVDPLVNASSALGRSAPNFFPGNSRISEDRTKRLSKSATATIIGLTASAVTAAVAAALDPGPMATIAGFIFIVTAIAFLTWFRLAFVVAQELSPELFEGLGSVWAVASWFVPLLNLAFPYVIARRIWKAFAQKAAAPLEPPAFFSAWWGCFVLSFMTGRLGLPIAIILFIAAGIFGAAAVNATTALIANIPATLKASPPR